MYNVNNSVANDYRYTYTYQGLPLIYINSTIFILKGYTIMVVEF